MVIEARQVYHILKNHGIYSKSDQSMSNDTDIAKMEYAIRSYDEVRDGGKTQAYSYMKNGHNRTAPTILYEKEIGDKSYYVIQAVPETKKRTLYIVTAFIGKKGYKNEASQLINAKSPDATAETGSVVTSNYSIPNSTENIKQNNKKSLSSPNTAPKKYGNYNVYGEDVMLEGKAKPKGKAEITAPTAKKEITAPMRADVVFAEGGVSSNFIGHNADGLEVYETSEEIKKLPYDERKKIFANLMATNFFGKTAKFKRNGHVYYAKFDESSLEKNIYGDKYSSPRGWKAKINVGADGNIFELVENSSYDHSKPEKGKKGAVHKNVGYWDYFIKTVQVDNVVYDVLINIRRKTEQDYVYSIRLWENKKIKASPPVGTSEMSSVNLGAQHFENSISHSAENVKKKGDFSLSSPDTAPKKYGDYAVYGEDVMLEGKVKPKGKAEITAPTRESILFHRRLRTACLTLSSVFTFFPPNPSL